jgi:hypothetical protein
MKQEIITLANKVLHDLNFDKRRTTTQIIAEAISNYAEEQVKLCNKPAVSKCEDIEREALLKLKQFVVNQKDLPDDINQIVNDNFWELF